MKYCKHCGEKSGKNGDFCCSGCQHAFIFLQKLNLNKYYSYCKNIYDSKPASFSTRIIESDSDYSDYITVHGSERKIELYVDGIHCGACAWLIESIFHKFCPGGFVRVNLTSSVVKLRWSGEDFRLADYVSALNKVGYKLFPNDTTVVSDVDLAAEKKILQAIAVSGGVLLNIMMLSICVWSGLWSGDMGDNTRVLLHWVSSLISVPAILYSSQLFFRSALNAILHRATNMDIPISIAIIFSTIISFKQAINGGDYTYFDSALTLIFFLLIGRFLEKKVRNRVKQKVLQITSMMSKSATLIEGGVHKVVSIDRVKEGDKIFVAAGEKIPLDGCILSGSSEIDQGIITGESIPITASKNDLVYAGSINLSQPISILVKKDSKSTMLHEIKELIDNASQNKSKYASLSAYAARIYTPLVLLLSLITFCVWYLNTADFDTSLLIASTVLIITCPCALGLAVPVAQVICTYTMMRDGILVKAGDAAQRLSEAELLILDKTGTVTLGRPEITNLDILTSDEKRIVASIASHSQHIVSKALALGHSGELIKCDVHEEPGRGLRADIDGETYLLGNAKWCGVNTEDEDKNTNRADMMEVWFKRESSKAGATLKRILLEDAIKPDAREFVERMKSYMDVQLLSGDKQSIVDRVARKIGIDTAIGGADPIQKYEVVSRLSGQHKTMMVGDGLNDTAALKSAYVSLSPSSGIPISQSVSDVVFHGNKCMPILKAFLASKKTVGIMRQNIIISLLYNVATIPVAMLGYVTPVMAAVAMSTSSVLVILNSFRIHKNKT